MSSESQRNGYNLEIDVLDILRAFWQGRKIVGISIVVCLVAGLIYGVLSKEVWVITARLVKPQYRDLGEGSLVSQTLYRRMTRGLKVVEKDKPEADVSQFFFGEFRGYMMSGDSRVGPDGAKPLLPLHLFNVNPGDGFVDVEVRAHTSEETVQNLKMVLAHINTTFMNRILDEAIADVKSELDEGDLLARSRDAYIASEIERALEVADTLGAGDMQKENGSQNEVVQLSLLGKRVLNAHLAVLRKSKNIVGDKIWQENNQRLKGLIALKEKGISGKAFYHLNEALVIPQKVKPHMKNILTAALLMGLIVGLFISLVRYIYNR